MGVCVDAKGMEPQRYSRWDLAGCHMIALLSINVVLTCVDSTPNRLLCGVHMVLLFRETNFERGGAFVADLCQPCRLCDAHVQHHPSIRCHAPSLFSQIPKKQRQEMGSLRPLCC